MQKLVEELQQLLPFKDTTNIGDIVLIAAKTPQMLMYALIRDIERDQTRKDEWWNVHMSALAIPLQKLTWTLRTPQMTGMEIFTMGGEERFVKAINFGEDIAHKPLAQVEKIAGKVTHLKRIK